MIANWEESLSRLQAVVERCLPCWYFGQSTDRLQWLGLSSFIIVSYMALGTLTAFGVIEDRGLFTGGTADLGSRVFAVCAAGAVLSVTLRLARVARPYRWHLLAAVSLSRAKKSIDSSAPTALAWYCQNMLRIKKCRNRLEVTGLFLLLGCQTWAVAQPAVGGIADRTTYNDQVTFVVTNEPGYAYDARLDGAPVPVGVPVQVRRADYHELMVFRTNTFLFC